LRIRGRLHRQGRIAKIDISKSQIYDADNVSFATPGGAASPQWQCGFTTMKAGIPARFHQNMTEGLDLREMICYRLPPIA
jgi:hypothetical protein